jgi:methylmalonyl-CoA mutase C-terminal domain/subunit
VIDGLREYDALDDTLVLVGGIIPDEDEAKLKEMGVAEVFGPGASMDEMIAFVRDHVPERR